MTSFYYGWGPMCIFRLFILQNEKHVSGMCVGCYVPVLTSVTHAGDDVVRGLSLLLLEAA